MDDPTIVVARAADEATVRPLIAAFRDHLGAATPSDETLAASLPRGLEDPGIEICLARTVRGEAVGYSHSRFSHSIWTGGPAAHLEDVFVREEHRGRGLGLRLMEFAMERARLRGARVLTLHTNENNEGAQAFYQRIGFAPETEPAWAGGREVLWSRRLDGSYQQGPGRQEPRG